MPTTVSAAAIIATGIATSTANPNTSTRSSADPDAIAPRKITGASR
jgi:hypothetical protein